MEKKKPQVCVTLFSIGIITHYHKLNSLKQHRLIIFQFQRSEVLYRALWTKVNVLTGCSFLEAVEKPFAAQQNSVPVVVGLSFLPSCGLSAEGYSQLLQATVALHDLRLPSSIFKANNLGWSPFHASNLSFFCLISNLAQKGSLILRNHVIRLGPPRFSRIISPFKVSKLNRICKIPFAM